MQNLGVDIGSRTIKVVVVEDGTIVAREVVDATSRPLAAARELLDKYKHGGAVATGYGRHLLELEEVPSVTEIKACARGVHHVRPDAGAIIDIGGQDVKVIVLDARGKIARFDMNDRCAAGTGRFLEIMAARLELELVDFAQSALRGGDDVTISSLCTVFAESEVVGLLNGSRSRDSIVRAIHRSVTNRICGMYRRIAPEGATAVLAGGGALNEAIVAMLRSCGISGLQPVEAPQTVCALGAALIAEERGRAGISCL
jgi:predicted CoA-substrate-specific enzyme activase